MILRITYADGLVTDHHADSPTFVATVGQVLTVELVDGSVSNPPWPECRTVTVDDAN